jgi:hypothetical protein
MGNSVLLEWGPLSGDRPFHGYHPFCLHYTQLEHYRHDGEVWNVSFLYRVKASNGFGSSSGIRIKVAVYNTNLCSKILS